jgi:Uma2 family endonuclease
MKLDVIDEMRNIVSEPYLLRLPGWNWERYIKEAPEMRFCEYENGDLIMHSPVGADHQRIVRFLTYLLQTYCRKQKSGEVLNGPAVIKVDAEIAREPDIFVLGPEESPASGLPLLVVPPLIVEVSSPSTLRLDLETKSAEYSTLGVGEYWVVDRDSRTLHWHFLEKATYQVQEYRTGKLSSRALKGFWIEVEWLWQDPLPSEVDCLQEMGLLPG